MIAVYAGSFDPITLGHTSVIERATNLFDELHILVANNRAKQHRFTIGQRTELVRLSIPSGKKIKIVAFEGIVADYVNEAGARAIVRGIRNATDFEYELQLEQYVRNTTKADTVYLSPYTPNMQTSSSLVRMFIATGKAELARAYMVEAAFEKMNIYEQENNQRGSGNG
ncbi:pantetheine-phosphate adenylyltransferase [Paenibacillus sp. UNC499MF]|uniref:pantetheine-phosphate adenylyltransferase n=1 Tax=Paenibacillus sp. UNC499MF TaxID=1502751 RepID=UPI00089F91DF|nr:pantetheine-phosphate adenylyltransferase [Paenibacillus sp. UNC499MF]SEG07839.1 Phosphopantetheine adenylyltransferase [Paenibacillus sp. UNC499MF]